MSSIYAVESVHAVFVPSYRCASLPEMVVIHSLSKAFTSLNSTAPARLGAGGLIQGDGSGCGPDRPGTPEMEAECSP